MMVKKDIAKEYKTDFKRTVDKAEKFIQNNLPIHPKSPKEITEICETIRDNRLFPILTMLSHEDKKHDVSNKSDIIALIGNGNEHLAKNYEKQRELRSEVKGEIIEFINDGTLDETESKKYMAEKSVEMLTLLRDDMENGLDTNQNYYKTQQEIKLITNKIQSLSQDYDLVPPPPPLSWQDLNTDKLLPPEEVASIAAENYITTGKMADIQKFSLPEKEAAAINNIEQFMSKTGQYDNIKTLNPHDKIVEKKRLEIKVYETIAGQSPDDRKKFINTKLEEYFEENKELLTNKTPENLQKLEKGTIAILSNLCTTEKQASLLEKNASNFIKESLNTKEDLSIKKDVSTKITFGDRIKKILSKKQKTQQPEQKLPHIISSMKRNIDKSIKGTLNPQSKKPQKDKSAKLKTNVLQQDITQQLPPNDLKQVEKIKNIQSRNRNQHSSRNRSQSSHR